MLITSSGIMTLCKEQTTGVGGFLSPPLPPPSLFMQIDVIMPKEGRNVYHRKAGYPTFPYTTWFKI